MDFSRRMRASMLIIIVFCVMCVASVLEREEQIAQAGEGQEQEDMYITCGMP